MPVKVNGMRLGVQEEKGAMKKSQMKRFLIYIARTGRSIAEFFREKEAALAARMGRNKEESEETVADNVGDEKMLVEVCVYYCIL